jgi:hypothetical protein
LDPTRPSTLDDRSTRRITFPGEVTRSDLEVVLLRPLALRRLPRRIALEFRHFVAYVIEMLAEFFGFEAHAGLASNADEMSLGVLLDLMHEDRIQMPALGAFHINGFIFEHLVSPAQVSQ